MQKYARFTFAEWVTACVTAVLLMLFLTACWNQTSKIGNITKAINNCKQISVAIHIYASDNCGVYPDAANLPRTSSNKSFRKLFVDHILDNEVIFGAPLSDYVPDGKIGSVPDFLEALKPRENHWAMTAGLTDASYGSIPLVYENPAVASWPPLWNADLQGAPAKGRVWKGAKIVIGLNDTSVQLMPLAAKIGSAVGLAPDKSGKNLFEKAEELDLKFKGEVLDIEE